MREASAKAVAIGTGLLVVAAVVLFAVLQQEPAATARAPAGEAPAAHEAPDAQPQREAPWEREAQQEREAQLALGMRVYVENRCARCHSIAGEGSPRSPLDGVGDYLDEEGIRLWIVAPREMDPRVRKPSYDLPEEELDALIAYMQSLRTPEE